MANQTFDADREAFLTAFAAMYDRLREASRAQLRHAAVMYQRELGGVVWIQIPSRPNRRPLPEAGYVSETPGGVRFG